jgi:hypothetical protein
MTDQLWKSLSQSTQKVIFDYIHTVNMCCALLLSDNLSDFGLPNFGAGAGGAGAGAGGSEAGNKFIENIMNVMKKTLGSINIEELIKGFTGEEEGSEGAEGAEGAEGNTKKTKQEQPVFEFPEKFKNGHFAKFIKDFMSEIDLDKLGLNLDEFGLNKDDKKSDLNTGKILEVLTTIFTKNPNIIKNIVDKMKNLFAQKIKTGALNMPLMMKELKEMFQEFKMNPGMSKMMESVSEMFGVDFDDEDNLFGN